MISALLYKHEIKAETHNGVKTQFFLKFIKSEMLEKKYGLLYSHLFDWRQEADYADFIEFDKETVTPLLVEVSDLMEKVSVLLNEK